MPTPPPSSTLFPYTTLFRSRRRRRGDRSGAPARRAPPPVVLSCHGPRRPAAGRSEEHTSELQSLRHLVCRLLLEKKKMIRDLGLSQEDRLMDGSSVKKGRNQ